MKGLEGSVSSGNHRDRKSDCILGGSGTKRMACDQFIKLRGLDYVTSVGKPMKNPLPLFRDKKEIRVVSILVSHEGRGQKSTFKPTKDRRYGENNILPGPRKHTKQFEAATISKR